MDYSKERGVAHLRGVAQALDDENRRLRGERSDFESRLASALAEKQAVREAQQAAESMAAERLVAQQAAETMAAERLAAQQAAETMAAERLVAQQTAEAEAAELAEAIATLQADLAVLKEKLALREQQLYGKKSERRPRPAAEDAPAAEVKAKDKPKKKQKGHGPTAQPDVAKTDVIFGLAGKGLICQHCEGTLEPLGTQAEEAELIGIEARRVVLERILRLKYQCPCCNTGVVTAPGPVKLIPGGRYALSFAIDVAFQKYLAHVPYSRQALIFRHEGLKVSTATLFDQVDALATALFTTFQAIWAVLRREPVLRADETPWAVLSNGHTENERFYAWCAVGSQYVGYMLLDTRSAEGARTILGDFKGTLMVDCLTSYPAAAKSKDGPVPRFRIVNCHAHARRKFVECEKSAPLEAKYALDLYKELYAIERAGKVEGADLGALRQEQSRPLIDRLFTWAREQKARRDILPSSGIAGALNYLLNHEAAFRLFLEDPAIPIDNNIAEQAMRAPVLGRKNHYGSRSRRGTEVAAILYTIIESAKRVGVSPWAYIEAAVETAMSKAGAVLLPDEFKRQLEAARLPRPPEVG